MAATVNPDYALVSFQEKEGEYVAAFERFLTQCYTPQLHQLHARVQGVSSSRHHYAHGGSTGDAAFAYSLRVCAQFLIDLNPSLAALLFRFPDEFLPLFHRALGHQLTTLVSHGEALPVQTRPKLRVRIEFLPPIALVRKPTISTIRSGDVKRLIQVAGTVVRTGMIKMHEVSRHVQCSSARCQYRFVVQSDLEQGNILELPRTCPSGDGRQCKSTQFEPVASARVVSDHQVIKIQEQVSKLGVGSIPRSILVMLEEDLVDAVKAGDHVVVVGVLMRSWRPCIQNVRCDLETLVRANSIRVRNASTANVLVTEELKKEFATFWQTARDHPMRGRNAILASLCPKVYGLFVVKLALALTIIGGCSHVDATGMKTRGEPHLLLIGDPGTGKSQFLRFAAELSPRSVLTTGIGTTSAGLTCTAVKDGSEWMLEAGALVLADKGVCCIDEFSSIRAHDRASIHEAMEQQTLSVAKAGLVCKLNARTTIFAVTNPKGRYDPNADVAVNTTIASPLLSRFDLILVLLDRRNAHWDEVVSSFILHQSTDETGPPSATKRSTSSSPQATATAADGTQRNGEEEEKEEKEEIWSVAKLQAYICHVKDKLQPQLTRGAMSILQRYYQLQRASESRSAARTTIRLLESLTRLSQAHARLLFHESVEIADAVVAVFLMEVSTTTESSSSSALLGGGLDSVLHSDFAEDPTAEYALQEKLVLEYLGLSELATVEPPRSQRFRSDEMGEDEEEKELEEEETHASRRKRLHGQEDDTPTLFQWQPPTGSSGHSRWGSAVGGGRAEQTEEDLAEEWEEHEDKYPQPKRRRQSQAGGEERQTRAEELHVQQSQAQPLSQSSWRSGLGKDRVARWSQLGASRLSDQPGGGDEEDGDGGRGGEGGNGGAQGRPVVTSKWWR